MQVLFIIVIFIATFRRILVLKSSTSLALANVSKYQTQKLSPQFCIIIIIKNTQDNAVMLFRALAPVIIDILQAALLKLNRNISNDGNICKKIKRMSLISGDDLCITTLKS